MKAKMKGFIKSMERATHEREGELVHITLRMEGETDHPKARQEARRVTAGLDFLVKPIVADDLKFGQTLYVTVSDEEGT